MHLKRDDELSAGISGSKYRKYASIIPYLKDRKIDLVVSEGSEYSNNLAGLSQLLKEYGIKFHFFLKKGYAPQAANLRTLKLVSEEDCLEVLTKGDYKNRKKHIKTFLDHETKKGKNILFLPEGSLHLSAFAGTLTLAYDISLESYDRILIDAGTGGTFLGLYFGMCLRGFEGRIALYSLVEDRAYFEELIETFSADLPTGLIASLKTKVPFEVYGPCSAAHFGKKTNTSLDAVNDIGRRFGVLTDPIYSGPHIHAALCKISSEFEESKNETYLKNTRNLIIHSGGIQSLWGFDSKP